MKKNFIIYRGKPPSNDPQFRVHPTQELFAVPYSLAGIALAAHYDLPHPPAIELTYQWSLQPLFASQVETARFLVRHPRSFVLSEMGTGKTRAVLTAIDMVRTEFARMGKPFGVLVLAPLSTLEVVWADECRRWFAGRLIPVVLEGPSAKKRAKLESAASIANVIITNHDAIRNIIRDLHQYRFDIVVIDELAVFRNRATERWRVLDFLLNHACRVQRNLAPSYVWGLTGTPMPNLPTDTWAQKQLILPHNNITKQMLEQQTMYPKRTADIIVNKKRALKASKIKVVTNWGLRPNAHKFIHRYMQPAIRFRRSDVYELPPEVRIERQVPVTAQQARAVAQLRKEAKIIVQGAEITIANAMVFVGKALQIYLGSVLDNDKKPVHFDIKDRLQAVQELIEQSENKVLLFANYRAVLHRLEEFLSKYYSVAVVHGGVHNEARTEIFRNFQLSDTPQVILAHPKTMSHGITLTAASTIVWYGPTWSAELYHQANARIARQSQNSKRVIAHLYNSPLEAEMFQLLVKRLDAQMSVLELFEKYVLT